MYYLLFRFTFLFTGRIFPDSPCFSRVWVAARGQHFGIFDEGFDS